MSATPTQKMTATPNNSVQRIIPNRFKHTLHSLILFTFCLPAFAANITVTDLGDDNTRDNGTCTLREAIIAANTGNSFDACNSGFIGHDTITIGVPGTITLSIRGSGENDGMTGDLDIDDDVTIIGAGRDTTIINTDVEIDRDRIFHILSKSATEDDSVVVIKNLTISDGSRTEPTNGTSNEQSGAGGAILNSGLLTLTNLNISNNDALGGGAIATTNRLTLRSSIVSDNLAGSDGGGALSILAGEANIIATAFRNNETNAQGNGGAIYSQGNLYVDSSEFFNNWAQIHGGGIYTNGRGFIDIVNTTFSANAANSDGGAIANRAAARVIILNTTFADNTAGDNGHAIFNRSPGSATREGTEFKNTLFSGAAPQCVQEQDLATNPPDVADTIISRGNNLSTDDSCKLEEVFNDIINGESRLNALRVDENSQTAAHPLLPNSDAVDAGNSDGCPIVDQRLYPRDSQCDIGAYEYNSEFAPIVDLSLSMSLEHVIDNVVPPTEEGEFNILLKIHNFEGDVFNDQAESITVTLPLINEVNFLFDEATGGNCNPPANTNTLVCTVSSLDKGQSTTIRLPAHGVSTAEITLQATVDTEANFDPFPNDNDAELELIINSFPVANDMHFEIKANTEIEDILDADDADGDELEYRLLGAPNSGVVDIDKETGAFTYTPNSNFFGPEDTQFDDSFTYEVTDGKSTSVQADVTIKINDPEDPPVRIGKRNNGGGGGAVNVLLLMLIGSLVIASQRRRRYGADVAH